MDTEIRDLKKLARLYGLQPAYYGMNRRVRESSPEAILRVLSLLGAPVQGPADVRDALRERHRALWQTHIEPVIVAWDGRACIRMNIPASDESAVFACEVLLEEGARQEWTGRLSELATRSERTIDGIRYATKRMTLPLPLPPGYHRLTLEFAGRTSEALLISAPKRAYQPDGEAQSVGSPSGRLPHAPSRHWGVFLPLYALHRRSSWGAGDFSDLEALIEWTAGVGGSLVATLPLLASLFELTDDPSPYSPASRLFWNEFYIDVTRVPEFDRCPAAREAVNSAEFQRDLEDLRRLPNVDYRRQMALKRRVLMMLAESFFANEAAGSERHTAFERFLRDHPDAQSYACYRAMCEQRGHLWQGWPEPLRGGTVEPADCDESLYRYHVYAQWQVQQQLEHLARLAGTKDLLWYLDFPLGVDRNSFDTWRNQDIFALEASGGAPPDIIFTKGQNWGFPPMHPQRLREQGYSYLIAALRAHLHFARILRFDHVMSLYRLYWVPEGMEATDGVYVRYAEDELFALLTLESHRHRALVVGENLGTVPPAVNTAMARHGVQDMYVVQYEAQPRDPPVRAVPSTSVASVNTHDMPPFAAYWTGLDIDDRFDLGLMDEQEAAADRENRARFRRSMIDFLRSEGALAEETFDPRAVLESCLSWLASSRAPVVLVNLEDLWQETTSQNTPGTYKQRRNWQHRARYDIDEFRDLSTILDVLKRIDASRRNQL